MVSFICTKLMTQMLSQDQQQQSFLLQKFSQPNSLQILKDLIECKSGKKGNLSLVNGLNFGCQYEGYFDFPIILFSKISSHFCQGEDAKSKDKRIEFLNTVS